MQRNWSVIAIVMAALSLGPSFAHVLESLPRLSWWAPELWREATVFNGQFILFAYIGGPLDVAAILSAGILAYMLRHNQRAFRLALVGAALLGLALAVWVGWVAPANSVLASWKPGPISADFEAIRLRWETGHMVIAGLKLAGLVAIVMAALEGSRPVGRREGRRSLPTA
jgi:hypothetical protein